MEGNITLGQREAISNVNGHSSQTTRDYYLKASRVEDVKNSAAAFDKMLSPGSMEVFDKTLSPDSLEDEDSSSWLANLFDNDEIMEVDNIESDNNGAPSIFNEQLFNGTETAVKNISFNTNNGTPSMLNEQVFNEAAVRNIYFNDETVSNVYETNLRSQSKVGENHPEKNPNAKRAEWTDAEVEFIGEWCSKTLKKRPEWSESIISKCNHFIIHDEEIRKLFHPNHIASSARLRHGYDKYRMKHGIPIGQYSSISQHVSSFCV